MNQLNKKFQSSNITKQPKTMMLQQRSLKQPNMGHVSPNVSGGGVETTSVTLTSTTPYLNTLLNNNHHPSHHHHNHATTTNNHLHNHSHNHTSNNTTNSTNSHNHANTNNNHIHHTNLIIGNSSNSINGNNSNGNNINSQPSTSLWVGNVDSSVTEEVLQEMFSAYGQLTNVRCLPEKYCAFVNFKSKDEANKAMLNLQVSVCFGVCC